MRVRARRWGPGFLLAVLALPGLAQSHDAWTTAAPSDLGAVDPDIARHQGEPGFFEGLSISEQRVAENGFTWQLLRFQDPARPDGPLWVVPHDDEDGAFEAMLAALRLYGGTAVTLNTPGERRMQTGRGRCGVRAAAVSACDPNRNFDAGSPQFVAAILDQRLPGQPVIALHTNQSGFAGDGHGGGGNTTLLDASAYRRGKALPRRWALVAESPQPDMDNFDTFGLKPFRETTGGPSETDGRCGAAMASGGVSFWHEPVGRSDGSLSNYIAINLPDVAYFNAESRAEADPARSAARHARMIAALLERCHPAP